VVSAISSVEQRLRPWRDITLAVKQQMTNFLAKFGATWLKRANHFATLGTQELF
jgi:hypothetical protein